ncbi:MAG: tetratricopeptide repeat protein [Thermodesulfobacteriota bacterium]
MRSIITTALKYMSSLNPPVSPFFKGGLDGSPPFLKGGEGGFRLFNCRSYISRAFVLCWVLLCLGCGKLPEIVVLHDPLTAEEHNDLGVSYENKEEYALAEREYREALKKKKDFFNAQFNIGNLYLKMGRKNEAEDAYQKAITLDPAQPDAYNNLACLYLQNGRNLDEAQKMAERAVSLSEPTPRRIFEQRYRYLDTLGMVYLGRGEVDVALRYLREALDITPVEDKVFLTEVYGHLAGAYRMKGDEVLAKKFLEEMVKIDGSVKSPKPPSPLTGEGWGEGEK